MVGLFITIDVEENPQSSGRCWNALQPLLERLALSGARATFFVVGRDVERWAPNLRELARNGHEIALHGWDHIPLKRSHPGELKSNLMKARERIVELTGFEVCGFRAPFFSLTKDTPWAPEMLVEAGFRYSSSVLPAMNPQAGFKSLPRKPFKWPSGLLEFPVPVWGIRSLSVPITGGAYLRLLPQSLIAHACKGLSATKGDWAYAHPYDFDVDENFARWENLNLLTSKLLHARRRVMLERVSQFIDPHVGTLGSSLELFDRAPVYDSR